MGYALKSRQVFIPGGFQFTQPETQWQAPRQASFEVIVQALIAHRNANPALRDKHRWPTDPEQVRNELDAYNAHLCAVMGWSKFIAVPIGEPPPPKSRPPSQSQQASLSAVAVKAAKIWSGVKTLNEWYDSNEPAVPAELSTARAKACSECPYNEQGDWSQWFTALAAEAMKRQVEKFSERKLSTPYDDKLNVCKACLCVNKLAVHAPLKLKLAHMRPDVYAELKTAPACWVVKEREAL